MRDLLNLIRWMLLGLFRSRTSLRAENLALRHQLNVLHRSSPKRPVFSDFDRLIFICLYRMAPRILDALTVVEPDTVLRWHRAGFRLFWRWKSRRGVGRPKVPKIYYHPHTGIVGYGYTGIISCILTVDWCAYGRSQFR